MLGKVRTYPSNNLEFYCKKVGCDRSNGHKRIHFLEKQGFLKIIKLKHGLVASITEKGLNSLIGKEIKI